MSNSPYSQFAIKRGAWRFLSGKALSAPLTFLILFLLVKILPLIEYGAYVTLVAGIEIGYGLSDFGLYWLAARYLPEYRMNASGEQIKRLCIRFLSMAVFSLLAIALIFLIFLENYLKWVNLDTYLIAALIYLGVFVIDGLGRFVREPLMVPMMMIDESRKSMVMRQLSFVVLIVLLEFTGNAMLTNVALAEIVAAFLSLIISLMLMRRRLTHLQDQASQLYWSEPRMGTLWRIAIRMYAANLLTLPYSSQAFINLIQRVLGVEAAGLFGFLLNLQGQIARYLPATLLFSIIRPKLVASYVGGGGMDELSRNANLAGKLSLFALMPLVVMAALTGDTLVTLLSGGKFMGSGWLFLGFMLVLVPISQGQLIESVAVASGHAGLCTWAAASGLVTLPLIWFLLDMGMGLWAAVIAIGVGRLLFNIVLVIGVSKLAGYRTSWIGFLKLAVSALATYGATAWLPLDTVVPDNWRSVWIPDIWVSAWIPIMLRFILTGFIYLSFTWLIKPFSSGERARINGLTKHRLFVW